MNFTQKTIDKAKITWPILVKAAKERQTITYKELAKIYGYNGVTAVRYPLHAIQQFCKSNNLPPITILVVNRFGKRGVGFDVHELNRIEEGLEQVYLYDWSKIPEPF